MWLKRQFFPSSYFLFLLSSLCSPSFVGLITTIVSTSPCGVLVLYCLQGLFLQFISDVITFSLREKIYNLFPVDGPLSIPVSFLKELKLRIMKINFFACKKTLGVLLESNSFHAGNNLMKLSL